MNKWIEVALRKVMLDYVEQYSDQQKQSQENALLLARLKELENDPEGLFKLGSVLKPSSYSAEELRDEYISEKYGI